MGTDRSLSTFTLAVVVVAAGGPLARGAGTPPMDHWSDARGRTIGSALTSAEGETASGRVVFETPRALTRDALSGGSPESLQYVTVNNDPEGDIPREVAFTPDGATVLIVNQDTDTLTFMDAATRAVVGSVVVGDFPQDVAVSPDGRYAVTTNIFTNDVSIVDVATRTLLASVPAQGLQPFAVEITPDSRFAVVAVINDAVNSQFTIVDLDARAVARVIPTTSQGARGFFGTPEFGISGVIYTRFALAPNGNDIVLPRGGSAPEVRVYDRSTGALAAAIPVAASPAALDVSADSTRVVVAHEGATRRVSVIDLPARTLLASRTTASDLESAGFIRITPDKTHAMCSISNNLIFVDLATGATAATIPTGIVGDIEISFDGQFAFVSNFNSSVINIASRTLARTITFAACAEAAVSPTSFRAVALNNRFREDAQFYNINGSSGSFEGRALTGALPEGDAPKQLAIARDGSSALVVNGTSRNVAILDPASRSVRASVDTGDRGLDAAISPDGSTAVVCNGDSDTVSVIDLTTDSVVATVPIAGRPGRVKISPDGQFAYILNVAGTDRIHKLRLSGPTSAVVATQLAGQTGSTLAYTFNEISGIELTSDGSLLGVCDSFNDRLILINTATMATVASVVVGDFPMRVVFNAAGTRAYVANTFSNDISVVNVAGAASATIATVPGISSPLAMNLDLPEAHLYVGAHGTTNPGLYVVDTSTNAVVRFINVGNDRPRAAAFTPSCSVLIVGATSGASGQPDRVHRFRADGPATRLIDTQVLTSSIPDLVYDAARRAALASTPVPDGIDFVEYAPTADVNNDGSIDLADFFEFFQGFDLQGPPADLNGDGAVDLADFFAFFESFDLGCP